MPKNKKKLITILIVIACIAAVYGVKTYMGSTKGYISMVDRLKVQGNNDAPLKITEFIDFECPACALGSKYLKKTIRKYPDLIYLQMKYFPLSMHRHGHMSAQYAECAAEQGVFWPIHDLLIERQGNWKRLNDAQPAFDQMANDVQLNSRELSKCLKSSRVNQSIEKDKAEGRALNIRSTPTYIVNGKMIVGLQSLQIEINRYLNENSN